MEKEQRLCDIIEQEYDSMTEKEKKVKSCIALFGDDKLNRSQLVIKGDDANVVTILAFSILADARFRDIVEHAYNSAKIILEHKDDGIEKIMEELGVTEEDLQEVDEEDDVDEDNEAEEKAIKTITVLNNNKFKS